MDHLQEKDMKLTRMGFSKSAFLFVKWKIMANFFSLSAGLHNDKQSEGTYDVFPHFVSASWRRQLNYD